MGLSGLSASFSYMNFALLIGQIYVFFRVLNDAFHRGKKSGLMHIVAQGREKGHLRRAALSLKIGCTAQDAVT
jgi:hypothetical protein